MYESNWGSSMVSLEEEDDEDDVAGDECLSKKKLRVNAHQASHTKYLLMKGYCIPGIGTFTFDIPEFLKNR